LAPRRSDWRTTLAVILPLGVVSLVLSPFWALPAAVVVFLGLALAVIGFKRIQTALTAKGFEDFNESAPFFLRGGLLVLIGQIYYTVKKPRTLGLWLFLELFGTALLISGLLIIKNVDPPPYPGYKKPEESAVAGAPVPGAAGRPAAGPAAPEVPRVTGDPVIDQALADLQNEQQPWKRGQAADRLAQMKPNEHRAVVAQRLADVAVGTNEFGRGEAARALAVWATPAQVPALIRCFRNGGTRDSAAKALRTVGPAAEKDVIPLVDDQDFGIRTDAMDVLKDIGTERSLPALQAVVDKNDLSDIGHARDAIAAIRARAGM
jgi:hypothetical protein